MYLYFGAIISGPLFQIVSSYEDESDDEDESNEE